jgi:hypothetical protein
MPAFEARVKVDSLKELISELHRFKFIATMPDPAPMIYEEAANSP